MNISIGDIVTYLFRTARGQVIRPAIVTSIASEVPRCLNLTVFFERGDRELIPTLVRDSSPRRSLELIEQDGAEHRRVNVPELTLGDAGPAWVGSTRGPQ